MSHRIGLCYALGPAQVGTLTGTMQIEVDPPHEPVPTRAKHAHLYVALRGRLLPRVEHVEAVVPVLYHGREGASLQPGGEGLVLVHKPVEAARILAGEHDLFCRSQVDAAPSWAGNGHAAQRCTRETRHRRP